MTSIKEEIQKAINLLKENGYEVKKIIQDKDDEYTFDNIWNLYDKKVGCKDKLKKKWNSMSKADRKAATDYVPAYVLATKDKKYRKNFQTFLNQRGWEDELVGGTPPPAVTNETASTTSQLIQKTKANIAKEQAGQTFEEERNRLLGIVSMVEHNPNSFARKSLESYYNTGYLRKYGITWTPQSATV